MEYYKKLKDAEVGLTFDDVLIVPSYSDVRLEEINLETKLTKNLKINMPIISSPMDTVTGYAMAKMLGEMGGIGILPRNLSFEATVKILSKLKEEGINVGVAVGPFDDERVNKYSDIGVSVVVIDTAHGHSLNVLRAIKRYKKYGIEVIAGNIATEEAAESLISAGADGLRVGIGCGHVCTTREITGIGVPQLYAVAKVSDVASKYGVGVIADGGIEKIGDIVKAIAAGADSVMLGYMLAGTDEAPGKIVINGGERYKLYRGMGSLNALRLGSNRYGEFKKVPEGIEGLVKYRGSVRRIIEDIINGIKQAMGYVGARDISELKKKAKFIRVTYNGYIESRPRGIKSLE